MWKMEMLTALTFVLVWTSLHAGTILQRNSGHYNLDSSASLQKLQVLEDTVNNSPEREDDEQHSNLDQDSKYYEQEDGDSGSNGIFQSIMAQMMKGHVNEDVIAHWMAQIKAAMSRGTISPESVSTFIGNLKDKLAGTSFGDTCCPLG